MASFVLRNATDPNGPDESPQGSGGVAVRQDDTLESNTTDVSPKSPLDLVVESAVIPRLAVDRARKSRLDEMIETEIIPRLMVTQSLNGASSPTEVDIPDAQPQERETIDAFVEILLHDGLYAAGEHIRQLIEAGASSDTILLNLFAPAARRLGEYWEDDTASFAEVTVGLSRLQQLLRDVDAGGPGHTEVPYHGHRVLLTTLPGEQHTFGIFMVEDFFRRAGWDVVTSVLDTTEDLMALVGTEEFSVIGFSMSQDALFDTLISNIHSIHKVSRNKEIQVLVGGRCFMDNPQRVEETGADGMARDGREAVALANSLVGLAAPR